MILLLAFSINTVKLDREFTKIPHTLIKTRKLICGIFEIL